ncbi:MAG: SDR family NAD(P)-dependent oxidoreductase [Actinomycetes bacterium]
MRITAAPRAPLRADGLRVLVTGSRGGIGGAARELLEARGAQVLGLDLAPDRDGDVVADVRDAAAVEKAVASAVDRLGGLDVLVNCAGIGDPVDAGAMPDETVARILDVNLLGTWRVTSAALPALLDAGGRVICLASGLAYANLPFASAYAVSKRGVVAYADALRLEYGSRISVTTLYPGYIHTGIHASSEAAGLRLGDVVPPESLADAAKGVLHAAAGRPRRDAALTRVGALGLAASRHLPRAVDRVVRGRVHDLARHHLLGSAPYAAGLRDRLVGPDQPEPASRTGLADLAGLAGLPGEATEHTVAAADGLPLHVEEYGPADAPVTVVLVHGWQMSARCWHRQVPGLVADGFRVLAYDHRGHGRSSATEPASATIDQLADDLAAVLEARVPTGPLVLAGHSMGGMTLMALAERHPRLLAERVAGLALVSTSPARLDESTFGLPQPFPALVHRTMPLVLQREQHAARRGHRFLPPAARRGMVRLSAFGRHPRPDDVALVTDLVMSTSPDAAAYFHRELGVHDRDHALASMRGVRTVLMTGTRDGLCPTAHTRAMAEALPEASLHVYRDAGHMLMLERAGDVTRVLRALAASCA